MIYDLVNPWDPARNPADAFYHRLVMGAESVLDVGCGTGAMLHHAREAGHRGTLAGIDPNSAFLERARRRDDIEWVFGTAAAMPWEQEFELAVMTGHAFQCLIGDGEIRASLAGVRAALHEGGRFVFETRHPQARAWETWTPSHAVEVAGVRVVHQVESVVGDVVTFTETAYATERHVLRFLDLPVLNTLVTQAGFHIDAQYGDWHGGPLTPASTEIITVAVRH
ncbi:class I SAM-dependent methyltransferase [Actinoplanes friuliensis]|uniref:Methyltransferase type 11 n=1 Tax=Actinoplanes friuliensis DSM 7358 TaxID=1246995 RepID=U5VZT8_9ACTN|nr:class I SAM-dependent methyltransferase [Actinoplanes friuliensis]AGZ42404.1 methyltransferase type 11 [Actinoplanes friuliensis DSM 7358]